MSRETVQQRMRLFRRLVERSRAYQINDIPLPSSAPPRAYCASELAAAWRQLAGGPLATELPQHYFNVYLHVPFCRAKCTYCMYDSRVLHDQAAVDRYADFLERQLDYFGAAFERTVFQNLHVGGGTPTCIAQASLRRILVAAFAKLRFAGDGSKVIESNPENVTEAAAELLAEYGFNKVSVGVQSMQPEVLELHGRGHQAKGHVRDAIARLRAAGAPYVNCDFMLGLAGDTAETFLRGLEELMELGPDTIMLTKLQPQWSYLQRHFGGQYDRFVAHYDAEFASAIEPMVALGERHGYVADNPYENELGWRLWRRDFVPPYDAERPYYCTGGQLPMSTLGLGRYAKSKIYGTLIYENVTPEPSFDPEAQHFRGQPVDRAYEVSRWVVTQIASMRQLNKSTFRSLFGRPPEQEFPFVLEALAELGAAEVEDEQVRFPSADTQELYIVSRLFLDRQAVIQELASADWDALVVQVKGRTVRFVVEHALEEHEPYASKAAGLGLALQASAPSDDGQQNEAAPLAVGVMLELFERATADRPWLSAMEVAEWMARRAGQVLARDLGATVTLESQG